jgi:c-di-GMP-binding flagellar brake protein YcgR
MQNKRLDYRYPFAPAERRRVEIKPDGASETTLQGEIVNLSVSGVAVRLDSAAPPQRHARLRLRFVLGADQEMALPAEVMHGGDPDGQVWGLRFLPLADLAATEARERIVWRFLMQEQRRARQEQLRGRRG